MKLTVSYQFFVLSVFFMMVSLTPAATLMGHWAMDEGGGTVLADSSGNGNNGTLISGTWTEDRFAQTGKAILLDSQRIDIPDTIKPTTVTLAAWINPSRYGSINSPGCIFSCETGSGASGFVWRFSLINDGILRMEAAAPYTTSTARYICSATGAIPLNEWHHVVGTYDGYTVSIYIDGLLAGSESYASEALLRTTTSIPSTIGWMSWGLQYYGGILDDARIYDGVLSEVEILELAGEEVPSADVEVNDGQTCWGGRVVAVDVTGLVDISFKAQYTINNGQEWMDVDNGIYTAGPIYWMVPGNTTSDECLVQILNEDGTYVYGQSDTFSIDPCSLTADLTGDCLVDLADFLKLAEQWLGDQIED